MTNPADLKPGPATLNVEIVKVNADGTAVVAIFHPQATDGVRPVKVPTIVYASDVDQTLAADAAPPAALDDLRQTIDQGPGDGEL